MNVRNKLYRSKTWEASGEIAFTTENPKNAELFYQYLDTLGFLEDSFSFEDYQINKNEYSIPLYEEADYYYEKPSRDFPGGFEYEGTGRNELYEIIADFIVRVPIEINDVFWDLPGDAIAIKDFPKNHDSIFDATMRKAKIAADNGKCLFQEYDSDISKETVGEIFFKNHLENDMTEKEIEDIERD